MSIKNNARSAWKELGKIVEPSAANGQQTPAAAPAKEVKPVTPTPAPAKEVKPEQVKEIVSNKKIEPTVIAAGTVIRGDIMSEGDVIVSGTIHGNIECKGVMQCQGAVNGNITSERIVFESAKVKGDLHAKDSIQVDQDSIVTGNVDARSIALDGKLKGDLVISDVTQLNSHAVLVGNITTKSLYIHEASRFSGSVKMAEGKELSDMFPKDNG